MSEVTGGATDVGAIRAKITADISGFSAGVNKAKLQTKELGETGKAASASFSGLNSKLSELGASSKHIAAINRAIKEANPEILERQLAGVRKELEDLGADSGIIDDIIEKMRELGGSASAVQIEIEALGATYVALSLTISAAIAKAVQTAGDFEQAMANVKAISEAVGSEFDALRDQAIKLGAATKFSASQAADAMAELAQAGFKTKDILASMPGVLALAASGNVDLATTAGITSAALNGFGLKAGEAARVADVLAKSSIDTNAGVTDLGYALKYVAPVAAAMSVSIEEAVAAIGELSNAGIQGEMAGTQLRAILLALASPSKEAAFYMERLGVSIKDSAGNILPLSNIIGQLTGAWGRLTEAQRADVAATLVGREAAAGFITLIEQGQGTLDSYTKSLQDAGGTAERVAGVQMDTLKGSVDNMTSALESAGITVGDMFLPAVRSAVEGITALTSGFTELDPPAQKALLTFTTVPPLILGAAVAYYHLQKAIIAVTTAMRGATIAGLAMTRAVPILGAIALAVGVVASGAAYLSGKYAEAKVATENFEEAQRALNGTLSSAPINRSVEELNELRAKTEEVTAALKRREELQRRLNELDAMGPALANDRDLLLEAQRTNKEIGELDEKLRSLGFSGVESATAAVVEMNKAIKGSVAALFEEQKAEIADLAAKNDKLKSMETALATYKRLSGAQKLDQSEKQQLIDAVNAMKREYPGLNALQLEDGRVRVDNIDTIGDQIAADRDFTDKAIESAKKRMQSLVTETEVQRQAAEAQIKNYGKILDAMNAVSGAKAATFSESMKQRESQMNGATPNVSDIVFGALTPAAKALAKETEKQMSDAYEAQRTIAEKKREIELASEALSSGDFTLGAGNKGGPVDFTKPEKPKKDKTPKEKTGKSLAEIAAEARKAAYEADLKTVQFQSDFYNLTADAQIKKYDALKTKHAQFLKESVDDARTLALQLKRLGEDSAKSRYDFSTEWIKQEERRMEDGGKSELKIAEMKLSAWTRLRDRYKKDSDEYKRADEEAYKARKDIAKAQEDEVKRQFEASSKWIDAEAKRMERAGKSESEIAEMKISAWTRVRDRYGKDTDYYKQADEQLYQSRKSFTDKAVKLAEDLVKEEKKRIDTAKKADLAAIEERKKAYVKAQDEKIAAIDELIKKEAELNVDADYDTKLAEYNARIDELASAVGDPGKQEREKTIKERDRFILEHDRDLRKRELESQKTELQKEKDTQLTANEDEKNAAEAQYTALTAAFDAYSGDIKTIEAGIAAFRVSESGAANAQILTELDAFIAEYNAKMAKVTQTKAAAQKDADLAEYNANKDAWDRAKAAGDTAKMAELTARNEEIRRRYGIDKDTGKLQQFSEGGIVRGAQGAAVPVIAHAGEIVLNAQQQAALFGMLDVPRMVAQSPAAPTYITQNIDMGIDEVTLTDKAGTAMLYDERTRALSRLQSMGVRE